jgi:hypothetical protein
VVMNQQAPQGLDGVQAAVERRRFDRYRITGASHDLQAQIQALQRARRDDDLIGRDACPMAQVALRDPLPQLQAAVRQVLDRSPRVCAVRAQAKGTCEPGEREQFRAGKRRTELHNVVVANRIEQLEHDLAYIERYERIGRRRATGSIGPLAPGIADVVARARHRFNVALLFECCERTNDGGRTDPALAGKLPHRRNPMAVLPCAAANRGGNLLGEPRVERRTRRCCRGQFTGRCSANLRPR